MWIIAKKALPVQWNCDLSFPDILLFWKHCSISRFPKQILFKLTINPRLMFCINCSCRTLIMNWSFLRKNTTHKTVKNLIFFWLSNNWCHLCVASLSSIIAHACQHQSAGSESAITGLHSCQIPFALHLLQEVKWLSQTLYSYLSNLRHICQAMR